MKVVYGYVFYVSIVTIIMTVTLSFLYIKKIRHLWFTVMDRFGLGKGKAFKLFFWLTFAIILAILGDSINTYYRINEQVAGNYGGILVYSRLKPDRFETVASHQHQEYINMYGKLREFYMAERNFMLTASTLFAMFIFQRFFAAFRKLYDFEVLHENNMKAQ
jgi:hypothetical protein